MADKRREDSSWIEAFIDCLESSTMDHALLDEAIALKQAHLPRRIYKYRRDCEYSRDNLKTDTIWMASPDSYNDPYDCSFMIAEEHLVAPFQNGFIMTFAKICELQDDDPAIQIAAAMSSTTDPLVFLAEHTARVKGVPSGNAPQQMVGFFSRIARELISATAVALRRGREVTKICSFSAVNDSILMWGHYAQDHKGFCIEYDLENLEPDHILRKNLYPIIYSPQLYDLTPFVQKLVGSNPKGFNRSSSLLGVLHKVDGWAHEEEWRLVSITQAMIEEHKLAVPTPSRVFLGTKMNDQSVKELVTICEQKGIEVCQMVMGKDRFELVPQQCPH